MDLPPRLYPQEIGRAIEVVPALGRATPMALAGGLTGLAARWLGAVVLMPAVAWVGLVELLTVAALTSSMGSHRSPEDPSTHGTTASAARAKKTGREEDPAKAEENDLLNVGKKTQPKKTVTFKPADSGHFQNAADRSGTFCKGRTFAQTNCLMKQWLQQSNRRGRMVCSKTCGNRGASPRRRIRTVGFDGRSLG